MKILIIDDDMDVQNLLVRVVSNRGHEYRVFGNAVDALELLQEEYYPLILLDWMLPEMDGLEFCKKVRKLPYGDRCVIIMITARDKPEDLQKVLEAGADDYISKPVTLDLIKVRLTVAEQMVAELIKRKDAEAKIETVHTKIRERHDDMLSILNQLRQGVVMTDEDGLITFLNKTALNLFGVLKEGAPGNNWEKLLPIKKSDKSQIRSMCSLPAKEREILSFQIKNKTDKIFRVDMEIKDDPENPRRKIFLFYDVSEVYDLKARLAERVQFHNIIGKGNAIQQLKEQINDFADLDLTVLIEGETGTGKELVARAIHFSSKRKDKPFVAVNTAGLSDSLLESQLFGHRRGAFTGAVEDQKGMFEAADQGTLFLDEIGDISPHVQKNLLRVLDDKKITRLGEQKERAVDIRIITATNRDLNEEVAEGRFRSDLLYRIRAARIRTIPLRELRDEIPLLVAHFLSHSGANTGKNVVEIRKDAMQLLIEYSWPGNVRELRSAVDYAVIQCKGAVIRIEDLPPEIVNDEITSGKAVPRKPHNEMDIQDALERAHGNHSEAARLLGISRATLYRHLSKYSPNE